MQLTTGRVHWGWFVFPLHNKSPYPRLSQTNRFPSDHNTRWRLLIIIVVNFTAINHSHFHRAPLSPSNRRGDGGARSASKIAVATDGDSTGEIAGLSIVCLIVIFKFIFFFFFFFRILTALACILISSHAYHWVWINILMHFISWINPILS